MVDRFRRGTKQYFIALLQAQGFTNVAAYNELKPKVAAQVKPWVFTQNVPGQKRQAKPLSLQYQELQYEINRVYSIIARSGNPVPADDPMPADEIDVEIDVETDSDEPEIEETPEAEKTPVKSSRARKDSDKQWFYDEWLRLRRWIADTAASTGMGGVDSLDSMRPLVSAKALIDSGIPAKVLRYAMCMHWPKATLDMAGVDVVDFNGMFPAISPEHHSMSGYVLKLAEARQNIMLIGPAGTGKSTCIRQVADYMELPYGETPMTPGATRGDLLGRHTLDGFIPSKFVEIYSGGGIFNFEEIDASDPSMLIVVNNALASNQLFNSVNGETYDKSPNFIAAATGNTFGTGSDSKYTGREKLDLATIDRFRMARVLMSLDEDLARKAILG